MKKLSLLALVFFLALVLIYPISPFLFATEKSKEEKPEVWCPATRFTDNDKCMKCHVMSGKKFVVKETKPDSHLDYPFPAYGMKILDYGKPTQRGYFCIDTIAPQPVQGALEWFDRHGIKHIVFEVYSYGGGVFDAWKIKGLFDDWKTRGMILETRLYGGAMSAGFLLFCAGTKGHRYAQPNAEIMWHEVQAGQWPEVTSPSKEEHKAEIYRHLQDNAHEWLATRGNMTKEELDNKVKFKEFWFNGREAHRLGFVDHLIGE